MKTCLGIRREDINKWERRVPLIPSHARELVGTYGLEIRVQSSDIRIFKDEDYRLAGIPVDEDLSSCSIILALKEIPLDRFKGNKVYVFFSHTIKGQSQNMPMLKRMMDLGCTLIDYERMVDEKGRRVLYFGNYAGHAGMVDTLWALGQKLGTEGLRNPFYALQPTYRYTNLVEAKEAVEEVARRIRQDGLPREITPCVFGFLGYGHVSQGAQEVFDILPFKTVAPADLPQLFKDDTDTSRMVFKVVFKEEDMVEPLDDTKSFDLHDYYDNPQNYRPVIEKFIPFLTALINGIYWGPQYPRFVTKAFLERHYRETSPRLRAIGDISCDIEGSIECTVKSTDSKNPVYTYDPAKDLAVDGFSGAGPVVLAVYNLPSELPLEASTYFSGELKKYIPALAKADFSRSFQESGLPDVLRKAVILFRGELTPDYYYLSQFIS